MELIKITEHNGQKVVSARELHIFLDITERFMSWFHRQQQYGFAENVDYVGCKVFNTLANQELQDYALTLDTAKEISMIQRSDKGKQARRYFIDCERQLQKTHSIPQTYAEALKLAYEQAERIEEQQQQIEEQKPLVNFATSLLASSDSILIGEFAKILTQNGYRIGQNRLFEYLRVYGYLLTSGERKNLPSSTSIERGLFEVKTSTITSEQGTRINKTAKITVKGQEYFINKFLKK